MITLKVSDDYQFIKLDDLNWCIQKSITRSKDSKGGKAGEKYWKNMTYHAKLGQACEQLARVLADDPKNAAEVDSLQAYADLLARKGREIIDAVEVSA